MEINKPEIVAEVQREFMRYERALTSNDVEVLDQLFWNSEHTVRLGATEHLYGFAAIQAFRAGRSPQGLDRVMLKTQITTFGDDYATAHLEFQRIGSDKVGRQTQAWARTSEGWRVVSAHVSMLA
ncbi:oxalurate catabolism protein HpxZ [Ottowia thiooxydans]|uniref:Oxalurate catabolism protein HpxZ n=1 Tax=Ottowia thiooxydans TaxID=219182 RepID=A0ABV2QCS7_9BURK